MKKSTIVLIVMGIVSLILGIIFSVASILALRSFGASKLGEFWDENKGNWSLYDVRIESEDGTDVYMRIPLPDRFYDEETGEYEGPFLDINEGHGEDRVWIEKIDPDEGESPESDNSAVTEETESSNE